MEKTKGLFAKFGKLPLKKKVQIIAAAVLTVSVITAIPVYAWFSSQKKAAEMYKVKHPDSLFINAAHREDQVNFDLGEINMLEVRHDYNGNWLDENGNIVADKSDAATVTRMLYAFSVSGANCKSYTLQMAHTTNNMFTYKIYNAKQYYYDKGTEANDGTNGQPVIKSEDIVPAGTDDSNIYKYKLNANSNSENPIKVVFSDDVENVPAGVENVYYVFGDSPEVSGTYINDKNSDVLGDKPGVTGYDPRYYDANYEGNTNVDDNAVPLYWQAVCSPTSDTSNNFCDYYILEVTFKTRPSTVLPKESDLVYFSVKRKT